jgi:hypothetical protein
MGRLPIYLFPMFIFKERCEEVNERIVCPIVRLRESY